MRLALTDIAVKNLKPPTKGQRTYFDRMIPGFGVRVSQGGAKTFTLMHGLDRRLMTIGRYPIISLAQARDKAKKVLAEKILGLDRLAPTPTFAETLELFKRTYNPTREQTKRENIRIATKHLVPGLGSRRIGEITTPEVAALLDKLLPRPGTANHVYAVARLIFRWAWRRRMIERSPLDGLPPPARYKPRDRVLSDDELRVVFRAAQDGSTFGVMIQLLTLTGQRKGQIAKLRREYIDETAGLITWPAELMKGNRRHSIPLSPMVAAIISKLPNAGYLLPARGRDNPLNGYSKSKELFDRRLENVEPYVIHDLRRTFASGLQALGVPIDHTEALLAHRSGSFAGIVAVYQRHSYIPQMREALEKWERHLASLLQQ